MDSITDLTFLKSFTQGNPDKMKKYIGIFLQMCPGELQKMSDHLAAGNYDALRATAHSLKPQITYMGINGGKDLIQNIENRAAEKTEIEKLPEMLAQFQTLCNHAITELTAFVNS
jgi:HPt (histidine-containing phosphotransfer) domain-containing protein